MKRYIIIGALLASAALAHAKLGDNYATICHQYGDVRGQAVKDWVYWPGRQKGTDIYYQFKDNRAVAITWKSSDTAFYDSEVWRALIETSGGQIWNQYGSNPNGTRFFTNVEHTMYGQLSADGKWFQIAYKSWIDRHGKWASDDNSNDGDGGKSNDVVLPPVQEKAI
jgi:hypothetical protein